MTSKVPSRRRRTLLIAGTAAAATSAGVGLAWWRRSAAPDSKDAPKAQQLGAAAPASSPGAEQPGNELWALRFERPEGGMLEMAALRGKPLLINFWATWCAPCVREMPQIDRFYREYAAFGWQVVGLAIDGPTPVREFLATKLKVTFPIGLAGFEGSALTRQLGNDRGGLPFTVVIDASGKTVQRKLGETSFAEMVSWAQGVQ